jgi:hypothetical protein
MLDLDKLSGDTAKQIIKSLLSKEIICPTDIRDSMCAEPTAEMKRVTDFTQMLFNKNPEHASIYYAEESNPSCWQQPLHKEWLERTIVLMEELQVSGEDELLKVYGEAKRIQEIINNLRTTQRKAFKLLSKMNGWDKLEPN